MDESAFSFLLKVLDYFKTAKLIRNRVVIRCFRPISLVCGKDSFVLGFSKLKYEVGF